MRIDILYNFLEVLLLLGYIVVCTRAEIGNNAVIKQVIIHHGKRILGLKAYCKREAA